jgi:formylglycine-generating enzyme required for sulfatase activity
MNTLRLSILLYVLTVTSLWGQPLQPAADNSEPGRRFKDCAICPEMVVIPAGSFAMGGSDEVSLPRPFAVGVYEVTVQEWNWCATTGGCRADVRTEAVIALAQWLEELFEDEDSDTVLGLLFLLPDFLKRQGLELITESPYPVTNVSALHSMGVGEIRTAVSPTLIGGVGVRSTVSYNYTLAYRRDRAEHSSELRWENRRRRRR